MLLRLNQKQKHSQHMSDVNPLSLQIHVQESHKYHVGQK
jgi:hypothetical protein